MGKLFGVTIGFLQNTTLLLLFCLAHYERVILPRPIINVNRDFGLTNIALTRTTLRQGAGAVDYLEQPPMLQSRKKIK